MYARDSADLLFCILTLLSGPPHPVGDFGLSLRLTRVSINIVVFIPL